ncbi:MAG: hypothetical protein SFZ23_10970 [Planctomycetota bacterium]|nr:hypothetical protein [Planctomycetota bacterium]
MSRELERFLRRKATRGVDQAPVAPVQTPLLAESEVVKNGSGTAAEAGALIARVERGGRDGSVRSLISASVRRANTMEAVRALVTRWPELDEPQRRRAAIACEPMLRDALSEAMSPSSHAESAPLALSEALVAGIIEMAAQTLSPALTLPVARLGAVAPARDALRCDGVLLRMLSAARRQSLAALGLGFSERAGALPEAWPDAPVPRDALGSLAPWSLAVGSAATGSISQRTSKDDQARDARVDPRAQQIASELERELEWAIVDRLNDHEQTPSRGVLLVAAALLDERCLAHAARASHSPATGPLASWFAQASVDQLRPLAGVVRAWRGPVGVGRALLLARDPRLAPLLADRLTRPGDGAERGVILERAHLLLHPQRRRALARSVASQSTKLHVPEAGKPEGLVPSVRSWAGRSLAERVGALRVIELLRGEARALALDPALGDADPLVRLMAARLSSSRDAADFIFDPCEHAASVALLDWSIVGLTGAGGAALVPGSEALAARERLARKALRLASQRVRRLAAQELEFLTSAGPGVRAAAPRQTSHAKHEGARETNRLGELLRSPEHALDALARVRRMGFENQVAAQIVELARAGGVVSTAPQARDASPSDVVRSSALAATARISDPRLAPEIDRLLLTEVKAGVGRARANAIEAIVRRWRRVSDRSGREGREGRGRQVDFQRASPLAEPRAEWRESLVEAKSSAEQRVRANAIRGLIEPQGQPGSASAEALDDIRLMLGDERTSHRLSAVWLAERVVAGMKPGARRKELGIRVVEVANDEPDEHVRRRALGAATRFAACGVI